MEAHRVSSLMYDFFLSLHSKGNENDDATISQDKQRLKLPVSVFFSLLK
jgi:hypothetical protein